MLPYPPCPRHRWNQRSSPQSLFLYPPPTLESTSSHHTLSSIPGALGSLGKAGSGLVCLLWHGVCSPPAWKASILSTRDPTREAASRQCMGVLPLPAPLWFMVHLHLPKAAWRRHEHRWQWHFLPLFALGGSFKFQSDIYLLVRSMISSWTIHRLAAKFSAQDTLSASLNLAMNYSSLSTTFLYRNKVNRLKE